ncbi:MAG: N-acetylneuraminate synthase [Ruminiclostridium sp.]|nr:N-acetylneuraminate synthase [Ruminiclostridium sp.]
MNNRSKVFIIAEIGVNHNGSLEMAKSLIDAAAEAGADAVKFQTFKAYQIMLPHAPKAAYQINKTDMEETQYEMVKKLELNQQMHLILKEHSATRHIRFMSTPFDVDSLDFLVKTLQLPIIKIASGEITNAPLLLKAARLGKKIILSTGMSTLGDIEEALGVLAFGYAVGKENNIAPSRAAFREAYYSETGKTNLYRNVSLLHCTTEYPVPFEDVNLRIIGTLQQCFGLQVGYSDHTPGIAIPLAAAALGACIIEKHITLDRNLDGPDHKASLEPDELSWMIKGIRQIEKALGNPYKKPVPSELKNRRIARKSIVAGCTIRKDEIFTEENLTVKRPEEGISPMQYFDLLGKTASKTYLENDILI